MEMTVFGADGAVRAERGPLRVSTFLPDLGSPVQVLITNDGISSGSFTLSCRALHDKVNDPDEIPSLVINT